MIVATPAVTGASPASGARAAAARGRGDGSGPSSTRLPSAVAIHDRSAKLIAPTARINHRRATEADHLADPRRHPLCGLSDTPLVATETGLACDTEGTV